MDVAIVAHKKPSGCVHDRAGGPLWTLARAQRGERPVAELLHRARKGNVLVIARIVQNERGWIACSRTRCTAAVERHHLVVDLQALAEMPDGAPHDETARRVGI